MTGYSVKPTHVDRPFDADIEPVQPSEGAMASAAAARPVDEYHAAKSLPVPSAQAHWLWAGALQVNLDIIRSLFKTDQGQEFLFHYTGASLEKLLKLLQVEPSRFFAAMHAYFEGTAGFFARAGEAPVKMIQERPLEQRELTVRAVFAGGLIVTIDKNPWLFDGLALADPQFGQKHEAARASLLKIDNVIFLDALRRELTAIDSWILALRSIGDAQRQVFDHLRNGLTLTNEALEYIRVLLSNSSRIFSSRESNEPSIVYWELRAIGHYLSNKFTLLIGYYDLMRSDPPMAAKHISRIIKHLKDYISITETNPFTFLPEIVAGLGGWILTKEAGRFLAAGVPAWLYPLIENMIQNAIRDHLKKDGEFEGMIGMISGGHLSSSTPQPVKADPAKWSVIFVKDNGNGIPDDIRPKIFVERVHADTSTHGNGEGLWNSFQLLTRRGGHIWFDTVVGVGTTFYVALPAGPGGFVSEGGDSGGDAAGQDTSDLLSAESAMLGGAQYGLDMQDTAAGMGPPVMPMPMVPRIR